MGDRDGVVFRFSDTKFWYVQADGPFEAWLTALSDGFEVEITDPHSRVIQIQGPASVTIMNEASNGEIDDSMGYFRSGFFEIAFTGAATPGEYAKAKSLFEVMGLEEIISILPDLLVL